MTVSAGVGDAVLHRGGPETAAGGRFRPALHHDALLHVIAGRERDSIRAAIELWSDTFDPRLPVDGGTYRLLPMVFQRMREWDVDHPLRTLLKGVYRRSLVENSRLIGEVAPVLVALTERGLAPVLLKGAALVAGGYYPTLATRPMQDVDILVKENARRDAVAVLDELGWRAVSTQSEMPFLHAGTFHAPSGVATIDLHWHALAAVQTTTSDRALTEHLRPAHGLGLAASIPDPTAQLIHTLVHGAESNAEPPVRWIADAVVILAVGGVDWGRVTDYSRVQHVGVRVSQTLEVLSRFAGAELPWPVVESMRSLPTSPLERWERRMMASDHSSLTHRISTSVVRASAARRSASTPSLLASLLRRYHDIWQVPWAMLPAVGARKFIQHVIR